MSFNKWKDEYGLEFEPNYSKETELDCKAAFKAGQQSRQNEIDELKMANHNLSVMTAEAESYSDYWKYELDKLQKRLDEINNHVEINYDENRDDDSHSYWSGYNQALRELSEIIKGEETK